MRVVCVIMEASSLTITLPDERATTSAFVAQALVTSITSGTAQDVASSAHHQQAVVESAAVAAANQQAMDDESAPKTKRLRISSDMVGASGVQSSSGKGSDKLEQRLGSVLCCSVCIDLPKSAVYQCTNGKKSPFAEHCSYRNFNFNQ